MTISDQFSGATQMAAGLDRARRRKALIDELHGLIEQDLLEDVSGWLEVHIELVDNETAEEDISDLESALDALDAGCEDPDDAGRAVIESDQAATAQEVNRG